MPGSTRPKPAGRMVENPKSSLPVNSCSTVALERENTECPEKYPGNGGVRLVPGLYGDHFSPGICSIGCPGPPQALMLCPAFAKRIAVIGRTPLYFRLMCQATMPASNDALCIAKNIFAMHNAALDRKSTRLNS